MLRHAGFGLHFILGQIRHASTRSSTQTLGNMHAFDAHYDEEGAARAERAFFLRSVRQLRSWSTFGPPAFLALVVTAGSVLGAPAWFLLSFGVALVTSVLMPVFFYFARPRAAAKLAREHPVRHISLSVEACTVVVGEHKAVVAWARIRHIWEGPGYLLLVLGKFTVISIPLSSLPFGAHEFIRASATNVA